MNQTLVDLLNDRANDEHTLTLLAGQDNETIISYRELHVRALKRLHVLQSRGLRAGDQMILLLADLENFVEVFWACLLGGVVPVPVAGGNSDDHRHKLFRIDDKLESSWLYTSRSALERLEKFARLQLDIQRFEDLRRRTVLLEDDNDLSNHGIVHSAQPDDTALIQFSSGSTSTPKGIVLTHRNLVTNITAIMSAIKIRLDDRMLSWMPLTHDMGLIGFHLTPVIAGIDHILMPTDLFVRRPGLWLGKASSYGATLLCSPNFGYHHYLKSFSPQKAVGLDLSAVRLVFNGAEPISAELCDRFLQTLQPYGLNYNAMHPVYGLAEATLAVTFPPLDTQYQTLSIDRSQLTPGSTIRPVAADDANAIQFVGVGKPIDHCDVRITSADRAPLSAGSIGHICIRGDNVTAGYYREDALNAAIITADGWLDTGDLGFVLDEHLYITGRAKDIIFVNGQNFYPHDIEKMVTTAELVEFGKLVVSSYRDKENVQDHVICFVQYRGDLTAFAGLASSIGKLVNASAGLVVQRVIPVPRIPKTTSGKVQRFKLVDSYLAGEFDEALSLLPAEQSAVHHNAAAGDTAGSGDISIRARLKSICQSQVSDQTVNADDNLFEIGISSLTLAQIHAGIDEAWPEQVDITDLFDYPSITALAGFLEAKLLAAEAL